MPRLHALELVPDDDGRDLVLRDWQVLRDLGLPSQLDHAGAGNTPHLTVVSAPAVTGAVEELAVARLGPLLPVRLRVAGVVLLGGAQVTVARVVDADDALVRAVLDVRAATDARQHDGWLPHVTLGRRVPRAEAGRVLAALDHRPAELLLVELRRWDPDTNAVVTLARAD